MGRVARNSIWNLSGWVAAAALRFITSPILIRLLGAEQYGLMALLNTILTPLGLLDLGISEATVKYVAESLGAGDYKQVGKYVRNTFLFNIGVAIIGSSIIVLSAGLLSGVVFNIPPESQELARTCLYWVAVVWFFTQTRQTFLGVVMAQQRYDILNVGSLLTQVVTILAGLAVVASGGDLADYMRVQGVTAGMAMLGWLIVAKRLLPGVSFWPHYDSDAFHRSFGFGVWQMLNNVGGIWRIVAAMDPGRSVARCCGRFLQRVLSAPQSHLLARISGRPGSVSGCEPNGGPGP